jgi:cytochrome c biogenesis protein CcdA/thiol-disulfide isomerase/thioredoxin
MILLLGFAFLAGVVTILSPCILPILPIILSSTVDTSGKKRPLGVVTGFVLSFTFFTLFLSTIVRLSGIPAESLRYLSIFILIGFGLSLFVPKIQLTIEKLFTSLTRFAPSGQGRHGFGGGLVVGLSLGLLWTPCVGPILASVISLAISGTVTSQAVFITLAYSLGTAVPMFIIMQLGSTALQKNQWLLKNSSRVQKGFGVLMVLTAIGIFFNVDRQFQTYILNTFPQYGAGLTQLEDNEAVKEELDKLNQSPIDKNDIGKPMSDFVNPKGPTAPEIIPGGVWFNTDQIGIDENAALKSLRGKVILVDFWTYSCINCQRTLPYLRNWWSKYQDKGLVIIGVHSPEFEFEKSENNVRRALSDFQIEYPVVQDNNFSTWRAYNNRYWPAKYLIDKEGYIRYTHFGEGAYDETEKMILDLLEEAGTKKAGGKIENPSYKNYSSTHETYLGYERIDRFASPERIVRDGLASYTIPSDVSNDHVAFGGKWNVMNEYSNPQKGSRLVIDFDAKEVFLVMRSKSGEGARLRVFLDDKLEYFGEDVVNGVVNVDSDRLYRIIDLPTPGRHLLRLEFDDNNAELYAFTFG